MLVRLLVLHFPFFARNLQPFFETQLASDAASAGFVVFVAAAELDDGNAQIREIRARKAAVDRLIKNNEEESQKLSEQIGLLNRDLVVKKKQLSECIKLVRVDDMDKGKDAIAERLIVELNEFLSKLREKRKISLETKIKNEIDILMHKTDFIDGVSMDILDNIIEINLLL